jgi:hypothetical protein
MALIKIENMKYLLILFSVITCFFCRVGIHQWKFKYVKSKVLDEHYKGVDEKLLDGRICKNCKQEQYFWHHITVMGWQNVL